MTRLGRGGRAVAGVLVLATVLGACQAGALGGAGAAPTSSATGAGGGAGPDAQARDVALQQLLDRHAKAVLAGDPEAFLADIDPRATEFRAQQEVVFRGLRKVPFQRFGYRLVKGHSYNLAASTQKWGPTAYVAAVTATHRMRGFDSRDAAEAMAMTMVRREGRWYLVADDEADESLPRLGHSAPWDLGEVAVAKGRHSVVIGDVKDQSALPGVARRADAAVAAVQRVWPSGKGRWPGSVVVYSARDPQVMGTYLDDTNTEAVRPAAVAVTLPDTFAWFDSLTKEPRVAGSRVVVDGAAANAEDDELLRHEVTHVATLSVEDGGGQPTWMVEGIAEYTARRPGHVWEILYQGVDENTARALDDGSYHLRLPFSVRFYDDPEAVYANYTASTLACAYVRERWGEARLLALHAALRRVDPLDEADTQDAVLRRVLVVSQASLERAATRAVRRQWNG